jgi:Protein of unknown function (DUF1697)
MECIALLRGINVGRAKRIAMAQLRGCSLISATTCADVIEQRQCPISMEESWAPDALAIGPQAAYLWCAAGVLDSKLSQCSRAEPERPSH